MSPSKKDTFFCRISSGGNELLPLFFWKLNEKTSADITQNAGRWSHPDLPYPEWPVEF